MLTLVVRWAWPSWPGTDKGPLPIWRRVATVTGGVTVPLRTPPPAPGRRGADICARRLLPKNMMTRASLVISGREPSSSHCVAAVDQLGRPVIPLEQIGWDLQCHAVDDFGRSLVPQENELEWADGNVACEAWNMLASNDDDDYYASCGMQGPMLPGSSNQPTSVYVGNLPPRVNRADILELLQSAGGVQSLRFINDHDTGEPKGFCFCEYCDFAGAQRALQTLNRRKVQGRKLDVKPAFNQKRAAQQPNRKPTSPAQKKKQHVIQTYQSAAGLM